MRWSFAGKDAGRALVPNSKRATEDAAWGEQRTTAALRLFRQALLGGSGGEIGRPLERVERLLVAAARAEELAQSPVRIGEEPVGALVRPARTASR